MEEECDSRSRAKLFQRSLPQVPWPSRGRMARGTEYVRDNNVSLTTQEKTK